MLTIKKITSDTVIDHAAEELKKYLRMMMPEGGDIKISYSPDAKDGFRLGLMQDFGLDISDAEDAELDDILYIDCDEKGGIIAGDNPRSVLLAVYEYLRQNGCRWLMPTVDGEYIPMQDIKPVKYRHKPSCRYRGWCNEGAEYQANMMDTIDFAPKVGLNVFMLEFRVPTGYYNRYYSEVLDAIKGVEGYNEDVDGNFAAMFADGQAEALEFLVDETTKNCGLPLKEIKLKPNILVVSIAHGATTEIANGNSVFQKGDIVVVVDTNRQEIIRQLNDIFA